MNVPQAVEDVCSVCNRMVLVDKVTKLVLPSSHDCPGRPPATREAPAGWCPMCSAPLSVESAATHVCYTTPLLARKSEKTSLRVFIMGSHSVGKTFMARWISKTYGLPLVTEVARSVLAERELPLEVLRADIERTADFQAEVFRRQTIAEDAAGDSFVSDRAFDNLAYAASHTISVHKIMSGAAKYIERLKRPGSVIFFVRPHQELCAQDGVRERENWEEIIRIDGMIRLLLELHDLDHVVVASLSMAERARTIRAVLSGHGVKPIL